MYGIRLFSMAQAWHFYSQIWSGVQMGRVREIISIVRVFGFLILGDHLNFKYYYANTEQYLKKYAVQLNEELQKTPEDIQAEIDK